MQWEFIANFTPPVEIPSSLYSVQYTPTYLYGALNSTLRSTDQVKHVNYCLWITGVQVSLIADYQCVLCSCRQATIRLMLH